MPTGRPKHDVVFGYRVVHEAGGPGQFVVPQGEAGYLIGEGWPRVPIWIGEASYMIAGPKGHIVNFLIDRGDQLVRMKEEPLWAPHRLCFCLYDEGVTPAGAARRAIWSVLGSFASGASAAGVLFQGRSRLGQAVSIADALASRREAGDHFAGRRVSEYSLPGLTARKVLEIASVVPGHAEREAAKIVRTSIRNTSFSNLAAWMFGS
jgi:hypothetical protein